MPGITINPGQYAWLGFVKETSFGAGGTPAFWPGAEAWSPNEKNTPIQRPDARKRSGRSYAATGGYDFSASLRPSPQPDTLFPLLAYAFGAQTTPALVAPSTTCYSSTLSFGTALPSLMFEWARTATDASDYSGCCIDTVKLSCSPNKELQADFGIVGQKSAINASPTAPTFPTTLPLINEAAPATATPVVSLGGTALTDALLEKWDLSLNNKLNKNFRGPGSRYVQGFPLGVREAGGSLVLSYSTEAELKDFLGGSSATSPQNAIPGLALAITVASTSMADATNGLPYQITFNLPNIMPVGHAVPSKLGDALQQTFTFDAYEASGSNNDLTATIQGTVATVY